MTPSKLVFFAVLGVLLILLVALIPYILFTNHDTPEITVKEVDEITEVFVGEAFVGEAPTPRNQSIINYKKGKCLVINRFDCPQGWGPSKGCVENLDRCESNYEALQKFCNLQCEEELLLCQEEVKRLHNNNYYESIYFRMGYYP